MDIACYKKKGVYCCRETHKLTGSRCMCTFSTASARKKHNEKDGHKFPTSDLKAWTHELHLSGKFAFCLATGSRTNRSNVINRERDDYNIKESESFPAFHDDVGHEWFKDGCYRKHRKTAFRASDALKKDLETLFQVGFQKDGPKKGKNKYSPEQALSFLKNLKLANGRRKYSHDDNNSNGALPTKLYIQGWFSRRKDKMAKEEREKAARFEMIQNIENIQNEEDPDHSTTSNLQDEEEEDDEEVDGTLPNECTDDIDISSKNFCSNSITELRYSKAKNGNREILCQAILQQTFRK